MLRSFFLLRHVDASQRSGSFTTQSAGTMAVAAGAGLLIMLLSSVAHAQSTLRALQMNLCNSGLAGCYAGGRAVDEAAGKITSLKPDIVTLNEICSGDVERLWNTMGSVWPGQVGDSSHGKTYAFHPAWNAGTNQSYKCANGQEFGNGIIWHSTDPTASVLAGRYAAQDSGSEKRTYVCVDIRPNGPFACTTHLSAASEPVALAQCRELMSLAVGTTGVGKVLVGGDFNLEYDTSDPENVQNCVPADHYRKGDGDVQHFIAQNSLAFVSRNTYWMWYTDHPAFLMVVNKP